MNSEEIKRELRHIIGKLASVDQQTAFEIRDLCFAAANTIDDLEARNSDLEDTVDRMNDGLRRIWDHKPSAMRRPKP